MKRIICVALCLIMLACSLTSCGAPKIEEIRDRLGELIEASHEVNVLLFGEGPETYERVYDPKATMQYHTDESGKRYYYFYVDDEKLGRVMGYRTKAYGDEYSYLLVSDKAGSAEDTVYTDSENGLYYIKIDYELEERDFYYDSSLPSDYDVIRLDGEYVSIEAIKQKAEKVYSADYLSSIYETLFTGVMISDDTETGLLTARYIEYEDTTGNTWFMKSNTYEPLMTEKRIFDLSSAKIARGSNSKRVRVELDSYLESQPNNRSKVIINLALQDGVWFLDNGTY